MPEEYHVITPIEEQWVDSRGEVREVVGRYMQTERASLARVRVVRMPEGRVGMGEPLSPAEFWQEP